MPGLLLDEDDQDGRTNPTPIPQPISINYIKRKMTIAKGFLDIGLLSANGNQLRNLLNFGNSAEALYYVILCSIIFSIILQIVTGVILLVAEKFDLDKDDECDLGDTLNTVTTVLVFVVLIINVFTASLGVDVLSPDAYISRMIGTNAGAGSHQGHFVQQ